MKGVHHIIVTSKGLTYNIVLERKITIIKGKSATGKTTLVEMISSWRRKGSNLKVSVKHDAKKLIVLDGTPELEDLLLKEHGCIFIADEGDVDLGDKGFCDLVDHSDNYFILISRLGCIAGLTYAISSIVELKTEKHGNVYYTSAVKPRV